MTITRTETVETLARCDSNGLNLYHTPGNGEYWASHANFRDDFVVASPSDFYAVNGWDYVEPEDVEAVGDEKITLTIEVDE